MTKAMSVIIISLLLVFCTITVSGQAPAHHADGLLTVLKPGQAIALKEISGKYELSFFEKGTTPLGYRITEVGSDFVVVEDVAKTRLTRIPVFSLSAIILLKIGDK